MSERADRPDRILIVGTTGSGKSTLAARLSELNAAPHYELDALNHRANWQRTPVAEFRECLDQIAEQSCWVVDGNYIETTEDILWPRAELIVWLDLPLRTILPRLIRRSVTRIVRRSELWHGNCETWSMFFSRDSIVRWAMISHARWRRELPEKLSLRAMAAVRLTHPREVDDWLAAQSSRPGPSAGPEQPPGMS